MLICSSTNETLLEFKYHFPVPLQTYMHSHLKFSSIFIANTYIHCRKCNAFSRKKNEQKFSFEKVAHCHFSDLSTMPTYVHNIIHVRRQPNNIFEKTSLKENIKLRKDKKYPDIKSNIFIRPKQ